MIDIDITVCHNIVVDIQSSMLLIKKITLHILDEYITDIEADILNSIVSFNKNQKQFNYTSY